MPCSAVEMIRRLGEKYCPILDTWLWSRCIPPGRLWTSTRQHSVTTQQNILYVLIFCTNPIIYLPATNTFLLMGRIIHLSWNKERKQTSSSCYGNICTKRQEMLYPDKAQRTSLNLTVNQNVQKMQKYVVNLSENVPNFTQNSYWGISWQNVLVRATIRGQYWDYTYGTR
jgi:hypothetical protein